MEYSPSNVPQTSKLDNWWQIGQLESWQLGKRCRLCLGRLGGAAPVCRGCVGDLPWWGVSSVRAPRYCTRAIVAFSYHEPVKTLIAQGKYRRDIGGCKVLGTLLAHCAQVLGDPPQVFVPVPMPWPRFLWRGQNHAELIAQALGARLGIEVDSRLMGRKGWQRPQRGLSRKERLRNLRGAFNVDPGVRGLHVGIVDDVLTTGATLQSAAKALCAAGARRVDAYVVAVRPASD